MSGLLQPSTDVVIRPVREDDQRYVCATWFRSMLGQNRAPSRRRRFNDQIDRVLDDKTTKSLVAVAAQDHERILGWIVFAQTPSMRLIHYLYVRDDERHRGIARRLIETAWPSSSARIVTTMRGPKTGAYLDQKRIRFVPLEDFLR